jgi:hypothetical protein
MSPAEHPTPTEIGHQRDVVLAATETLLVHADSLRRFRGTAEQPTFHGSAHDLLEVCQSTSRISIACTSERAASMTFTANASNIAVKRPCGSARGGVHSHFAKFRTLAARHAGSSHRREVNHVQMPPLSLRRMIATRTSPPA